MARPVTTKIIKEHWECSCGKNVATQRESTFSEKELKDAGYRLRRLKSFPGKFFFKYTLSETCTCADHHFDDDMDDEGMDD